MKLLNFLQLNEARGNPHLSPKNNALDILKQYKDRDDIYISFTALPKIGINPKSQYNTPLGIYSYPLKTSWIKYNIDDVGISGFPFASSNPYIWIMESNIRDLSSITKQELDKALNYVRNFSSKEYDILIDTFDNSLSIGRRFWYTTRALSTNPKNWNKVFRSFGFNGISNKEGDGIIHPNEPLQAVFFTINSFKIIKMIENTLYKKNEEYGEEIKNKINLIRSFTDENELYNYITNLPAKFMKYIKNPSEDFKKRLIRYNTYYIEYIKNPSNDLLLYAIKLGSDLEAIMRNPTVKKPINKNLVDEALKMNLSAIQYVDDPSPELQMKAVKSQPVLINYIKNPTEEVLIYCVERLPNILRGLYKRGIKPSIKVLNASLVFPSNIKYIPNPTYHQKMFAIKHDVFTIQYIKNPTDKMKYYALIKSPSLISVLTNVSEKLKLAVVKKQPHLISELLYNKMVPSEELQMEAINSNETGAIGFSMIENMHVTKNIMMKIIEKKPNLIAYLNGINGNIPSKRMCEIAIKADYKYSIEKKYLEGYGLSKETPETIKITPEDKDYYLKNVENNN